MIDFHTHILPGIDDGSKNIEMTMEMLEEEARQGVTEICATPHFYAHRMSFDSFLEKRGHELKSEYFIPGAVDEFMKAGLCDVRVYSTDAQWYGVTYAEDKEYVKNSIQNMIARGEYPKSLWS
jgi:protein-tyrosine phosphatase